MRASPTRGIQSGSRASAGSDCGSGAGRRSAVVASTCTKDKAYSDVVYVEQLIAPGVINTMPEATLLAFDEHGKVQPFDADSALPIDSR